MYYFEAAARVVLCVCDIIYRFQGPVVSLLPFVITKWIFQISVPRCER